MPLGLRRFAEAYSVAAVVMIFLFSAGNLLSIRHARGVDPGNSIRTGAAGRLQALLFAIYPVTFAPVLLGYLARYAFGSQAALFAILGLDAIMGLVVYRVALDSAVRTADLQGKGRLTGMHTQDDAFVLVRGAHPDGAADVQDVAATALDGLGLDASGVDGRVLR